MTAKLRHVLLFAACSLPAVLSSTAGAEPPMGYQRVSLTLTCKEATGILKMHGYRDIAELNCRGDIYRFEVSRVEGRFVIDIDPHTGNIVRRQRI